MSVQVRARLRATVYGMGVRMRLDKEVLVHARVLVCQARVAALEISIVKANGRLATVHAIAHGRSMWRQVATALLARCLPHPAVQVRTAALWIALHVVRAVSMWTVLDTGHSARRLVKRQATAHGFRRLYHRAPVQHVHLWHPTVVLESEIVLRI